MTTGPRVPISDTGPAPRRRIASETIHTGSTVENSAIATASPITGAGWTSRPRGRVAAKWTRHSTQAMVLAAAVTRAAPSRPTACPLPIR